MSLMMRSALPIRSGTGNLQGMKAVQQQLFCCSPTGVLDLPIRFKGMDVTHYDIGTFQAAVLQLRTAHALALPLSS